MFYHQGLLQRRGQFGVIWMEAMQSSPYRITKRQALQVNVRKSCSHIVEYVYGNIRDERGKRTRFSLYLSAHLMYGVVSIWRKQVHILLADAQEVKYRVKLETTFIEGIDLRLNPRLDQVNLPDAVSKAATDDPLFGSFKRFEENWEVFLQERINPEVFSPALSLSPPKAREIVSAAPAYLEPELGSPHTVSSKSEITMKEVDFSTSPHLEVPIPGELDIPMLNGEELEMLTEKPDEELMLTLQDLLPDARTTAPVTSPLAPQAQISPIRGENTPEKAQTEKAEGRPKGEKKRRKREADLDHTRTEEPSPPKRPAREEDYYLEPLPMEVRPRRNRPRRELFVDDKKEITKSEIRENFTSTDSICREFVIVQTSLKDTPARLFKMPGSQGVSRNPIFRQMWERNCVMEETDSVIEMQWDLPQYGGTVFRRARREESLEESSSQDEGGMRLDAGRPMEDFPEDMEQAVRETPSMEKLREASLSRSRTPQLSPLQVPMGLSPMNESALDHTGTRGQADRSREGSLRAGSVERASTSSVEAHSSLHTVGSRLAVLPEEMEEMQLSPPVIPPLPVPEEFSSPEARFIRQHEEEGATKHFTFRAMCPPTVNTRPRAAKCFYALLERCAQGTLFVRQHRPYGDIYISASRQTLPQSPS